MAAGRAAPASIWRRSLWIWLTEAEKPAVEAQLLTWAARVVPDPLPPQADRTNPSPASVTQPRPRPTPMEPRRRYGGPVDPTGRRPLVTAEVRPAPRDPPATNSDRVDAGRRHISALRPAHR